ncbi:MAG: SDR family oxidoreductase [Mycobacteriales bacterium]
MNMRPDRKRRSRIDGVAAGWEVASGPPRRQVPAAASLERSIVIAGIAGRNAVVTGAAGGIGAAICTRLSAEGANVLAVDLDGDAAGAVVEALPGQGLAVQADVSNPSDTTRFVSAAVEAFGSVDLFVANAGLEARVRRVVDFDRADFERVFAVNVLGAFLGASAVVRQMLAQASPGSIVFTASMAALRGNDGLAVYVASKHAVLGLARSLAHEVKGSAIRVNTLCPGPVDTRMMRSIEAGRAELVGRDAQEVRRDTAAAQSSGRYLSAEEVAAAAVWLLGEECGFMHNEVLTLGGGGG